MTAVISSIITAVHLAALSQIESGDNDRAASKSGDVSRYQVSFSEWRRVARVRGELLNPTNPLTAKIVAFSVWSDRVEEFYRLHRREPDLVQLYLLWHRPATQLSVHSRAVRAREMERAKRFEALYLALAAEANRTDGTDRTNTRTVKLRGTGVVSALPK